MPHSSHRLIPSTSSGRLPNKLPNKLLFSIFGVLIITLSACGGASSAASSGPVTLTFWSWVPNLQPVVDSWNATHPNIQVKFSEVTSGQGGTYAKMFTAIKAKNAPDLGQIEYQFLPTFEGTGGLADISQYIPAGTSSKFVGWTWNQVTQGKAVYAVPQDTGPMALFYRKDLFTKYNISVPTTWAEYADAAAKLHAANPSCYITNFGATDPGWIIGLMWQAGGRWFRVNNNAWTVGINDTASQQVANYWQGLVDQKLVKTDADWSDAWYKDLDNCGSSTWVSAAWGANTIISNAPDTKGDWAVAPMPQWTAGGQVAGNWGGSSTVVFKDSAHPKEAAEFALWLNSTTQPVELMVKGAQLYPALTSELSSPAVNTPSDFYGGQVVNQVFGQVSSQVDTQFQWGPTMDQVFTDMNDALGAAVSGNGTLSQALDTVQTKTVNAMKAAGISVNG